MPENTNYPECEKLAKVSHVSNEIGYFLDWLGEKWIVLASYSHPNRDEWFDPLVRVNTSKPDLLAEYFEIDMKKVEEERNQIIAAIQSANK